MNIKKLTLGSCATNCYMLIEDRYITVIDPTDEPQPIISYAENNGLKITDVLITHGHFDHVGGVKDLQDIGAKVYMTETDFNKLNSLNAYFGFNVQPFDLDVSITDGTELFLSGHKFKTVSTAGHTPGSVCFILDNEIIFTGDTLFRLSVGRVDFPLGNGQNLKRSLKKLLDLNGNYIVLPGHGASTDLDYERKNNPYANL